MYALFIKNRRKEKGITQIELAKHLNVGVRTYKRLEKGSFTVDQLIILGKILSFSVQIVPDECKIQEL